MLMTMKMMMAIKVLNSINLTFKMYFQKREALLLNVPGEETRALSNAPKDIFVKKEFSVACDVKYIGQERSPDFSITYFNFAVMC